MKGKQAEEYIRKSEFFQNKRIEIKPLQKIQNLGWTFLVTDLDAQIQYRVKTEKEKNEKEIKVFQFLQQFEKQDWMPEIIKIEDGNGLLITPFIKGNTLNDITEICPNAVVEIGENLYKKIEQIHSIEYAPYDIKEQKQYSNWYALIKKQYEGYLKKIVEIGFLNEAEKRKIENFIEGLQPELEKVRTTFVHADLKGANIVYQKENNQVFPIDFEICFVGDPDYDWARIIRKVEKEEKVSNLLVYQSCLDCNKEKMDTFRKTDKYLLYYLKVLIEWYVLDAIKIGGISETPKAEIKRILQEI